jgi:hypothetical protein
MEIVKSEISSRFIIFIYKILVLNFWRKKRSKSSRLTDFYSQKSLVWLGKIVGYKRRPVTTLVRAAANPRLRWTQQSAKIETYAHTVLRFVDEWSRES